MIQARFIAPRIHLQVDPIDSTKTPPASRATSATKKELFANEHTRRLELVAFLAEKQASGMSYDDAWALAKKDRAALFEQMARR